jgi:hypothetical protein
MVIGISFVKDNFFGPAGEDFGGSQVVYVTGVELD